MSAERLLRGTVSRGICWLRRLATACLLWVKKRHVRRERSCPLYPRKLTCALQSAMSALGQKQTFTSDLLPRHREPVQGFGFLEVTTLRALRDCS
jgi:hypothetical protein